MKKERRRIRRGAFVCSSATINSVGAKYLRKASMAVTAAMLAANLPIWAGVTYNICGITKTVTSHAEYQHLVDGGIIHPLE